jgi:hypothetical protein
VTLKCHQARISLTLSPCNISSCHNRGLSAYYKCRMLACS